MAIERIPVPNRETWLAMRQNDVTASVVGALLGVHEYQTPYGLYALKTGLTTEDPEESPAMRRGRLFEPVAVQVIREEHPEWEIKHNTGEDAVYLRDSSINLGATVDVFAKCRERGPGVIQIKSVQKDAFARNWIDPETREVTPPLWIVLQAIAEAHLAGAKWAAVAPLVVNYGVDLPIVHVPIHDAVIARMRGLTKAFWAAIENDDVPLPDFDKDAAIIHRLFAQDDGTTVQLAGDRIVQLLAERVPLKAAEAAGEAAAKRRRVLDTEIIQMLGDAASGVLPDGTVVTAKTTHRKGYEVRPSSFRTVRVKPGSGEQPGVIEEF